MEFHPSYEQERNRLELALRLISVEARTRTIRKCTGLSDDRIRKIYSRYFRDRNGMTVQRRRGKSPCRVSHFTRNPSHQLEATTLFYLLCASGLMRISDSGQAVPLWAQPDIEYGERLCRAFDSYRTIHPEPHYNFEWTWALLTAMSRNETLGLASCRKCRVFYVHDRYAINFHCCPGCEIRLSIKRRPGAGHFR